MKIHHAIPIGLLAALLAGCGPATYPVTCAVVYEDGTPVPGATVSLQPESGGGDALGSGLTGDDGVAKMKTSAGDRMLPGKYKVLVTKIDAPSGAGSGGVDPSSADYVKMMAGMKTPKNLLAAEHGDMSKAPVVTVPPTSGPIKVTVKKASGK